MPRTTIDSTIERIRRQLASSFRYEMSQLGASLSPSSSTVQLAYDLPPSLRNGAVLSIGGETMRVIAVNLPAKECTVLRGWQDSDGEAHQNGDEVWINPRFTALDIYEAMVDELTAWGPDLYRVIDAEVAVANGDQTIQLPTSMTTAWGLVDVRMKPTFVDYGTPYITNAWPSVQYRLQRSAVGSSASPTSGMMIRLIGAIGTPTEGGRSGAGTAWIRAACPFNLSSLPRTADLVDDVGLQPSMLDVLTLGVKWRLMGDQENQRSARVAQDTPRMAEETPPMAAAETGSRIRPLYVTRKLEEINKLRHLYPVTFS